MTGTALQEVYRRQVLAHSRNPHNCGKLENASHSAEGFNPLCGDKVAIFLDVNNDRIGNIGFEGAGCAISVASASMMTDLLKGKTIAEASKLTESFQKFFSDPDAQADLQLESVRALEGVKQYRSRIKCATLAWCTFDAALSGNKHPISTEQ